MQPLTLVIVLALIVAACTYVRHACFVTVNDYQTGLRMRFGRVVGQLEPGLTFLFPGDEAEVFDLREQLMTVAAQEVTTGDTVPVKASLSISYKLVSPQKARESTTGLEADLYRAAQVALRETLTRFELETLLSARAEASAGVRELLAAEAQHLGVEIVRAVVLDVIVRGELKSALSDIFKARAEARSKLERARGETAVLRTLSNAARMLREHGGLYELRALEVAQQASQGVSNTLVLGLDRKGLELSNDKE